MRHGTPHHMGIQRYDIPAARALGAATRTPRGFRVKARSPVNSPLMDAEGRVVGVLHGDKSQNELGSLRTVGEPPIRVVRRRMTPKDLALLTASYYGSQMPMRKLCLSPAHARRTILPPMFSGSKQLKW